MSDDNQPEVKQPKTKKAAKGKEKINDDPRTHVYKTLEDGSQYLEPVKRATYIKKIEVEICPVCGLPKCYCRFSEKHDGGDPKAKQKAEAAKAAAAAQPPPNKKQKTPKKIEVIVKERNKYKSITTVTGLEKRGVNIKEFTKALAKKMSCSAASKDKGGEQTIVIQGDAGDQVVEMIETMLNIPTSEITLTRKIDTPAPVIEDE